MTHHIVGNRHQIYIAGTLAVAEQSTLHPVCTGQNAELRIADTAASVVVGMHA